MARLFLVTLASCMLTLVLISQTGGAPNGKRIADTIKPDQEIAAAHSAKESYVKLLAVKDKSETINGEVPESDKEKLDGALRETVYKNATEIERSEKILNRIKRLATVLNVTCEENYYYNPTRLRCLKCKEGYIYNPTTGDYISKCKEGYIYDPTTGDCIIPDIDESESGE